MAAMKELREFLFFVRNELGCGEDASMHQMARTLRLLTDSNERLLVALENIVGEYEDLQGCMSGLIMCEIALEALQKERFIHDNEKKRS